MSFSRGSLGGRDDQALLSFSVQMRDAASWWSVCLNVLRLFKKLLVLFCRSEREVGGALVLLTMPANVCLVRDILWPAGRLCSQPLYLSKYLDGEVEGGAHAWP